MTKPFYSSHWYRIAGLKPRLKSDTRLHRQQFRGTPWYVLEDQVSQRYYRFSLGAYALIQSMDGRRTVQEIWEEARTAHPAESPGQGEILQLLAQLYSADALECDGVADVSTLLSHHDRINRRRWQTQLLNPLSWHFPLFDPDRILDRFLPPVGLVFSRTGAVLWCGIVGFAVVLAATHWHDLIHDVTDRVLAPENILLLWLLFPLVKTIHEAAHAFATKRHDGEVHEMGIMLLLFQPVPYVDASSAYGFREKRDRMLVGAAGMLAEMFVAAIALFLWVATEPGLVRTLAYNTIFIAGVSTLVFNANPLLRYDGYYIFCDFLEIPNLRARSEAYVRYLFDHYLLGSRQEPPEAPSGMERLWLTIYPPLSCTYRLFLLGSIAIFAAQKFFFLGALIAVSGILSEVLTPLAKFLVQIHRSTELNAARRRAVMTTAGTVFAALVAVVFVPLPLRTQAQGVMWIPDEAHVRAGTDGFVERIVAQPGSKVHRGDVLIICRDPQLAAQVKILESRLGELKTRYAAQWLDDIKQAQIMKDEISHIEQRLGRARDRFSELVIRSKADGSFVIPQSENLPGRFVQQGARLGYVLDFTDRRARVVVPQTTIDLVRERNKSIEVRLAERLGESIPARLLREVPAASDRLPSTALGTQGGGSVIVDPGDQHGVKALEKVFQIELAIPQIARDVKFGGRVYVRFDHGWEPVAYRWVRGVRQLFLSKFDR